MQVVYSNWNKTAAYSVKKIDDFKTVCSLMRTFILNKTDTNDFRKPAFCTPYPDADPGDWFTYYPTWGSILSSAIK